MPNYRLSYPAHIYATVKAKSSRTAARILADVLDQVQDGILIQLDGVEGEMLYPDSDERGEVTFKKVEVENVEDDES